MPGHQGQPLTGLPLAAMVSTNARDFSVGVGERPAKTRVWYDYFLLYITVAVGLVGCNTPGPYRWLDFNPVFSPDGTKVVFTGNRISEHSHRRQECLWVMDADGSNQHPLPGVTYACYAVWSPDSGTLMFYNAYFDVRGWHPWRKRPRYVQVNMRGDILQTFEPDARWGKLVAFHHNGKKLIWVGTGLWLTELDGTKPNRVCDFSPLFSASQDWSRAVFWNGYEGENTIYALELKEGAPRKLCAGRFPLLSPDGKTVVYLDEAGKTSGPSVSKATTGNVSPTTARTRGSAKPDLFLGQIVSSTDLLAVGVDQAGNSVR